MECIFCKREAISQDILHETQNFFVKVGVGIVTPGHIMIIPKKHYLCFGELPKELEKEFQELKQKAKKEIAAKFSKPFLIEYGIWGQSVNHAHIHLIPTQTPTYQIQNLLEEMVIPYEIKCEKSDFEGLKKVYYNEKQYVNIEVNNQFYIFHVENIPFDSNKSYSNLSFRKFFIEKKGLKGIRDWEEMSEKDKYIDEKKRELTKALLKDF